MKKLFLGILAVLIVFSFTMTAMAFPSLPNDLSIIAPDPALPKELAAFSAKWEGKAGSKEFYLIVERIDQEKATLRLSNGYGWETVIANVEKKYKKYTIWFTDRRGQDELSLRGKYLDLNVFSVGTVTLTRVP